MNLNVLLLVLAALAATVAPGHAGWRLIWNDEFTGSNVDSGKWTFDIGTGPPYPGWGNNELQYYTSRPENVQVTNGLLRIIARKESYAGANYTSARLKTLGRFARTYGRFEFRARLPAGRGYWPAFWLMPRDSVYGAWAASGEIDIMELRGQDPTTVFGTLHFGGEWPANTQSLGPSYKFPAGDSATNFHNYALEWSTNSCRWLVDGALYQTQTSWWSSGGPYPAPFNQPFFVLMNLAVGGNFPGSPDATTVFPAEIQVDYLRIYEYTAAPVIPFMFTGFRHAADMVIATGSNGPPRGTFYLLSTSNLAQPVSRWARVLTNQFDSAGGFTLTLNPVAPVFFALQVP